MNENKWFLNVVEKLTITSTKKINVVIPFDFKLIENRFNIFTIIVTDILNYENPKYDFDSILESSIDELVSDSPDPGNEYFKIFNLIQINYSLIEEICLKYLLPIINNCYIITDVIPLGDHACITLEITMDIDFSTENFYQHYL